MEKIPERLLELAYGNHPKSAKLKIEGAKIIRLLREGPKTIEELAAELSVDLSTPGGKKHLYLVLRPLREKGMIAASRIQGRRLYHLSLDGFNMFLRELKREAERWLTPLRERVEEG